MKVKSIAECSPWSLLQYFRPSLSYHLSLRSLFCQFLSGCFTQVLLYISNTIRNFKRGVAILRLCCVLEHCLPVVLLQHRRPEEIVLTWQKKCWLGCKESTQTKQSKTNSLNFRKISQVHFSTISQGYKTFFILNSAEHEIILLIDVKMPTIAGILTIISMIETLSKKLLNLSVF